MSPKTSLLLLALNFVAVGVLYSRFSSTDAGSKLNVQLQSYLSSVFPSKKATCGLLHWDGFVLVSERVVLPDGVRPAAGEWLTPVQAALGAPGGPLLDRGSCAPGQLRGSTWIKGGAARRPHTPQRAALQTSFTLHNRYAAI